MTDFENLSCFTAIYIFFYVNYLLTSNIYLFLLFVLVDLNDPLWYKKTTYKNSHYGITYIYIS